MPFTDVGLCCSILRGAIPKIVAEFDALDSSRQLKIVCTLRTTQEQEAAYARGRTLAPIGGSYIVTKIDGLTVKGKHQAAERHGEIASHAVDFGVMVNSKYDGKDTKLYEPLMAIAEAHGLRSGQDWDCDGQRDLAGFHDFPHAECLGSHADPHPAAAI